MAAAASTRFLNLIVVASLLCLFFSAQFSNAQSTTTSSTPASTSSIPLASTSVSTTATIYSGTSSWAYYGCWNETTLINGTGGLRALNGGTTETLDTTTVGTCLSFCQSSGFAFAGLEYTRECYCAPYLSALSARLPDSACNLACEGNSTQICGGALTITVYQAKSATKGAAAPRDAPVVGSILALGIAVGVLVSMA